MMADESLFSPQLLCHDQERELLVRPLARSDFHKGFCQLLGQLTEVGTVTEDQFIERFQEMKRAGEMYYVVVIEDISISKIIGAASLVVEKKFLHECGKCGHIEDVVVDASYRGKNLGKRIIDHLLHLGQSFGCYKIILDCSEKNVEFYERCGFKRKEVQMVKYIPTSRL